MGRREASILIAATLLACARRSPVNSREQGEELVIEDVTLISPERDVPLSHAFVMVRDGRIAQVGTGVFAGTRVRRIDGRGRFLMPGLIDSHVHIGNPAPLDDTAIEAHPELLAAYRAQLPRAYLAFGFTTLVDLDSALASRAWYEASRIHPRLFHCGRAVRIAGGYGAQRIPETPAAAEEKNLVYEPADADRWPKALDPRAFTPERAVDRVVAASGICVKTFVEPGFGGAFHWPIPRAETLTALQTAARRRRLLFIVHANGVDSWRAALASHADVIAHGVWHWEGPLTNTAPPPQARDVIAAAGRTKVDVQPTLQTVFGDQSIFDSSILEDPRLSLALPHAVLAWLRSEQAASTRRALADEYRAAIKAFIGPAAPDPAEAMSIAPRRATATLAMMLEERVRLLFGSDTGSNEGIGNPPGLNGRMEMQRWSDAGVTPAQILRAATLDNAAAFGLSADLGSIEPGKRADLLLLRSNPLDSVDAYDAIEVVFVNGEPFPRNALAPAN